MVLNGWCKSKPSDRERPAIQQLHVAFEKEACYFACASFQHAFGYIGTSWQDHARLGRVSEPPYKYTACRSRWLAYCSICVLTFPDGLDAGCCAGASRVMFSPLSKSRPEGRGEDGQISLCHLIRVTGPADLVLCGLRTRA